jgi:hypothetical protein
MPAQQLDTGKSRISALSNNPSSQALVRSTDDTTYKELEPNMKGSGVPVFIQNSSQDSGINTPTRKTPNYITRTQWITVAILTYVNLINYMDRYTIAGMKSCFFFHFKILNKKKTFFHVLFIDCRHGCCSSAKSELESNRHTPSPFLKWKPPCSDGSPRPIPSPSS